MKRFGSLLAVAAILCGCSYGPLYRGPTEPRDSRVRRLGSVTGSGTGYNSGMAAGRATEELQTLARQCGADQVIDVYESGECAEPMHWLLFFLPHCTAEVRGVAITYRASVDGYRFQRCIAEKTGEEIATN